MPIGDHIRVWRRSRGWSVRSVAAQSGVSHLLLRKLESGQPDSITGRPPVIATMQLLAISRTLKVSDAAVAHLLGVTPEELRIQADGSSNVDVS